MPSASDVSESIVFGPLIEVNGSSECLESFDQFKNGYSLDGLAECLGINVEEFLANIPQRAKGENGAVPSKPNERLAKCIVEICSSAEDHELDVQVNHGVPQLEKLPLLYCTTRQRPDVVVYQDRKLCFTVEVHSSHYSTTLKKTIIGCVDTIRLLRNADTSVSSFTAFAFPNIDTKTTVVEVTVTFESLRFVYSLQSVEMQDVKNKIRSALNSAHAIPTDVDDSFVVKLSPADLDLFSKDARQLPSIVSASILVECREKNLMYKVFSNSDAEARIGLFRSTQGNTGGPKRCVKYGVEMINERVYVTTYNRITYDPLTPEEAKFCLFHLMNEIKLALDELHGYGFAHNDVRLPNVCFGDSYEAVLIDLDMSSAPKRSTPLGTSCMYRKPPGATAWEARTSDLVQLGWLAAYVCDSTQQDYHGMKFENLSSECQNDVFLRDLLQNAKYSEHNLSSSIICKMTTKTIEQVIKERP